jgi:hypothetical protein
MLRALDVDNSTKLFELSGAPFVAALLKCLGPDFNACLVGDMSKGAVLLGIDLGASFLAEVRMPYHVECTAGWSARGTAICRVHRRAALSC